MDQVTSNVRLRCEEYFSDLQYCIIKLYSLINSSYAGYETMGVKSLSHSVNYAMCIRY